MTFQIAFPNPKVELAKSFSLKCQSLSEGISGKTEEHLEMAKIWGADAGRVGSFW